MPKITQLISDFPTGPKVRSLVSPSPAPTPVQGPITDTFPQGRSAASRLRCPWELHTTRVAYRLDGPPEPMVPEHEAESHAHPELPGEGTGVSSHLQRQRNGEDPKEEGHQPKAADEEGSPSHALDDQALGEGQRETVITLLLAASEGDPCCWGTTLGAWLKDGSDLKTPSCFLHGHSQRRREKKATIHEHRLCVHTFTFLPILLIGECGCILRRDIVAQPFPHLGSQ